MAILVYTWRVVGELGLHRGPRGFTHRGWVLLVVGLLSEGTGGRSADNATYHSTYESAETLTLHDAWSPALGRRRCKVGLRRVSAGGGAAAVVDKAGWVGVRGSPRAATFDAAGPSSAVGGGVGGAGAVALPAAGGLGSAGFAR